MTTAQTIETPSGTKIAIVDAPTKDQLSAATREQRKCYERNHAEDQKALAQRRAAEAAMPSDMERREAAVEGLKRLAAKAERKGLPEADALRTAADRAVEALQGYVMAGAEAEAAQADPLEAALNAAAKQLRKTLKDCFANDGEAREFALRNLPLLQARRDSTLRTDRLSKLGRKRARLGREFWEIATTGAAAAGLGRDADAVKRLVDIGQL
jgi:hypothetical protein